ncbi:MAG TPA: hypothetical protein VIL46_08095, partial [Gemmataceae bacterium]
TNAAKVKGGFQVSGPGFGNTSNTLVSAGSPEVEARLWLESPYGPHTEVATSVYVDGTAAAQFFLRGQDLQTPAPSYYAVSVGRGGAVSLLRSAEGRVTELASARPIETLGDQWLRVRFQARGQTLRVLLARSDTGQYLTPSGAWTSAETAALTVTVPDAARGGYVGLVRPSLTGGRAFFDDLAITALPAPAPAPAVPPPPPVVPPPVSAPAPALPSAPRHYSHIRLAQLAYAGTPLSAFEQRLLRESIDVVIPNPSYLQDIARAAPGTPRIIYSNVSNIYLGLLTDWLAYADAHGHSRESAFYHVTEATPFTGGSASSVPVNWFWSVQRGAPGNWTDLTAAARNANERFQLAAPGESVVIGYTERFRELNLRVTFPGSASWGAVLEYVSAVNPDGSPAAWSALPILSDGTLGLRRSGAVVFDPPADWVAASLNGGDRLYHVRIRSIGSGAAPVVGSILGRDYVQARGGISGVIPAFDYAADRDGDGYLNDAEYARRRPGMDARFEYESRAFYPAYGQMRFATNPSSPGFRAWAVDYTVRLLDAHPLAGGVFLDNSPGRLQIPRESVRESTGRYAEDFGTLLGAINRATGPKWVLANTAGGREDAEPTIRSGVSFLEEFGLRPLAHNHVQFEDMAALVEQRLRELAGRGYAILDTLPQNGSPTDPRTQIAALAYYYLLADPDATMLMFFGGAEPNTSWTRHWVPAAAYDVGRPAGG